MANHDPMDIDEPMEPMDIDEPMDRKPNIKFILCCHGSEINTQSFKFDFEFKSLSFFVKSGQSLHCPDISQPIPTYICQDKY